MSNDLEQVAQNYFQSLTESSGAEMNAREEHYQATRPAPRDLTSETSVADEMVKAQTTERLRAAVVSAIGKTKQEILSSSIATCEELEGPRLCLQCTRIAGT